MFVVLVLCGYIFGRKEEVAGKDVLEVVVLRDIGLTDPVKF